MYSVNPKIVLADSPVLLNVGLILFVVSSPHVPGCNDGTRAANAVGLWEKTRARTKASVKRPTVARSTSLRHPMTFSSGAFPKKIPGGRPFFDRKSNLCGRHVRSSFG